MKIDTKAVQRRLAELGFNPGAIDGIPGPNTDRAIVAFKRSRGLRARPYLGPITLEKLFGPGKADATASFKHDIPWMNEAAKHMGLHERRNFKSLFRWLRSDGAAVGDPRKLPWCGDFVETAIKLTMPDEKFPGNLGKNPYLARNWLLLGYDCGPRYGAVVVFWRGRRNGYSGHVGFAVGYDPIRRRIRVRGGNQSNAVTDTWLSEDRLLGYRCPETFADTLPPLPRMNSAGAVLSTNEA